MGPLLPALALLGAFCQPWRGARGRLRVYVALTFAAPILATFFVLWNDARYYFIFAPLLYIWAANGISQIGIWVRGSSAAAGWYLLARPAVSQCLLPGLVVLAMVATPARQVRDLYQFSDSAPPHRIEKQLGEWIAGQQSGPIRIMDLGLPLSYHAGADRHVYFPYATEDIALRYIAAVHVDYLILRRGAKYTKYYQRWLAEGIPDGRAQLLPLPALDGAADILVYRWHSDDASRQTM
jgi:hypothetical protein